MGDKARVLVADHQPAIRAEFSEILTTAGFLVEEAGTADRFLAATRTNHHDVILLDEDLPDIDCGEICRHIFQRTGPGLRRPAILVLKPAAQTVDRTDIRHFCDGTLPYPCRDSALVEAVATMVQVRNEDRVRFEMDPRRQVEHVNTELRKEIVDRRRAERLFRALLESAPDAMVVADQEGRIILVNAVTEKLFGFSRDELLGKSTEFLVPPRLKQIHVDYRERYRRNPRLKSQGRGLELEGQRKDGTVFPAEISLGPVETDEGLLVVCAISDLTRRKARQRELEDNLNAQRVIGSILRLSLEPLTLDDFLQQTLELILDLPWLAVQNRGAIFVVEDESDTLVMKAHHQLSESLLSHCARVPFGKCLCGRAAATGQTVFADDLDHRHETVYEGIQPHGHYCVPIVNDDVLYGVINLYLPQGHRAEPHEQRFLKLVADALAGSILSKRTERDLAATEAQLMAAQSIQEHILAHEPPELAGFDIAGAFQPAEFAAGDHYDYFLLKDGSLAFGIGDVSGHGFSSALLMASTHAYIHALATMELPIAKVFDVANENLAKETDDGQFITAIFGRIDPVTRELTYVSAGHPTAYVVDRSGKMKTGLKSTGLPLAVLPDVTYEEGPPVTLAAGDKVLMVTDGVLETESPDGAYFDTQRVFEVLEKAAGLDAQQTVDALFAAVERFHGGKRQDDDVTAVVIRVTD